MRRRTMLMFVLTVLAAAVWALAYFHVIDLSTNLADFFGGAAVGFGIGAVVAWAADR